MKAAKNAFTLTELLVVVVVLGVLAAVTVPKFNRVLETRRTTEAESLMAAVRTEQEKRCTFEKPYAGTFDRIGDVISRNPSTTSTTKSATYTYNLEAHGMAAKSTRKDYALKILSYKDGRLCCSGAYCDSLNKDYPKCDALNVEVEGNCKAPACELDPTGCECNPNQCKCPAYSAAHCECTNTCVKECSAASKPSTTCNECGTRSVSCNTATGTWQTGTCSVASAGECKPVEKECPAASKPSSVCNTCGTRSVTCNTATGTWSTGACSVSSVSQCYVDKTCPAASKPDATCNECGTRTVTCDNATGT